MAHADIHVLGSIRGYTTVARSAGVSEEERTELETLAFGDATGIEARSRLSSRAVMTGRRLRSGRFAISRMLPGGTDDVGRPTVEVVTLLLEERDHRRAIRGIATLAGEVGIWIRARSSVTEGIEVPGGEGAEQRPDRSVLRAFDLWIAARRGGSQAVLPEAENSTVFRLLSHLDSRDLGAFRWGIGLPSLSVPADILTHSPDANLVGARSILRALPDGRWHFRGMEYAEFLVEQRGRLPASEELLVGALGDPSPFRPDDPGLPDALAPRPIPAMRMWSVVAAVVGTIALLLAMVDVAGTSGLGRASRLVAPHEVDSPPAHDSSGAMSTIVSPQDRGGGSYGRRTEPVVQERALSAPGQPDPESVPAAEAPPPVGNRAAEDAEAVRDPSDSTPPVPESAPSPSDDRPLEEVPMLVERPGLRRGPSKAESAEESPCGIDTFAGALEAARRFSNELKSLRGKPVEEQTPVLEQALCVLWDSVELVCRELEGDRDRIEELEARCQESIMEHQEAVEQGRDHEHVDRLADRRAAVCARRSAAVQRLKQEESHRDLVEECLRIAVELKGMGRQLDVGLNGASRADVILGELNGLRRSLDRKVPKVEMGSPRELSRQVNAIWHQLKQLEESRGVWLKDLRQ